MSVIHIRAADAASALDEVARRFGADALIVSTSQKQGFVEVSVARDNAGPSVAPRTRIPESSAAMPDLPTRLVLLGPPGAGVTTLAARLAALHLRRKPLVAPHLVAPRPEILAPPSPLPALARLLGLEVAAPLWPDARRVILRTPDPGQVQIVDLSGMGARGLEAARGLLTLPGAVCWLALPTGLHLQMQERLAPRFLPLAHAIVLTRADLCPPTLEDRALPQRFGLPIALLSQGTGLPDALHAPETRYAQPIPLKHKDALHAAAHLS